MRDHASNPFCHRSDIMPSGWACASTVADQLFAVRCFDLADLRRVLELEGIGATVRRAAKARLSRMLKGGA